MLQQILNQLILSSKDYYENIKKVMSRISKWLFLLCISIQTFLAIGKVESAEAKFNARWFGVKLDYSKIKNEFYKTLEELKSRNIPGEKIMFPEYCFRLIRLEFNDKQGLSGVKSVKEKAGFHLVFAERYGEFTNYLLEGLSEEDEKYLTPPILFSYYELFDLKVLKKDFETIVLDRLSKGSKNSLNKKIDAYSYCFNSLIKIINERREKHSYPKIDEETVPPVILLQEITNFKSYFDSSYEKIYRQITENLSVSALEKVVEEYDNNKRTLNPEYGFDLAKYQLKAYEDQPNSVDSKEPRNIQKEKTLSKIQENIPFHMETVILPTINKLLRSLEDLNSDRNIRNTQKIEGSPVLKGMFLGQSRSELEALEIYEKQSANKWNLNLLILQRLLDLQLNALTDREKEIVGPQERDKIIIDLCSKMYVEYFNDLTNKQKNNLGKLLHLQLEQPSLSLQPIDQNIFENRIGISTSRAQYSFKFGKNRSLLLKIYYDQYQLVERIEFKHEGLRELFNITNDMKLEFIAQQFLENVDGINEITPSTEFVQDYEQTFEMHTAKTFLKYSHQSKYGWEFSINQFAGRGATTTRSIILRKTKIITF